MITRAVSLLVIIGDTETLRSNPKWKEFIQYCEEQGALSNQ